MRVIVFAQDLSGRGDDGYYTKPNIDAALDIFFRSDGEINFLDSDADEPIARDVAKGIFDAEGRVSFFNADGEIVRITLDASV